MGTKAPRAVPEPVASVGDQAAVAVAAGANLIAPLLADLDVLQFLDGVISDADDVTASVRLLRSHLHHGLEGKVGD